MKQKTQSGGIDVESENVKVEGSVVGRDAITSTITEGGPVARYAVIGIVLISAIAILALALNSHPAQHGGQNSPVTFLPIPDKDLLVKGFRLNGSGEQVSLKFVAKNFDLDFNFLAPFEVKCDSFLKSFMKHFGFWEYIQIDTANFPTGLKLGFWEPAFVLVINGTQVDDCGDQTLKDMALVDGDLIGLKIKWNMLVAVSRDGSDPTGETEKQPPDVFP